MMHANCVLAVFLACASVIPQVSADPQTLPEGWLSVESSNVVLQYPPELEKVARVLFPKLDIFNAACAPAVDYFGRVMGQRNAVLALVAEQLSLDAPTPNMERTFDLTVAQFRERNVGTRGPWRLRLYSVEVLDEAARGGRPAPGFTRNPDGKTLSYAGGLLSYNTGDHGIHTSIDISMSMGSGTTAGVALKGGIEADGFLPVAVSGQDDEAGRRDTEQRLDGFLKGMRLMSIAPAGCLIHEIAESGLVNGLWPFHRWFSEGAANYIAGLCLERFLGRAARDEFLSTFFDSSEDERARVDLAAWPFLGWEPGPPDDLSNAYYAVATEVVGGLVERHGEQTVPNIVRHLRQTPNRDPDSLAKCLKEVTGETLDSLLPRPPHSESPRAAVAHIVTGPFKRRIWGTPRLIRETNVMTLKELSRGGIAVRFGLACLKPPTQLDVALYGADSATSENLICTRTDQVGNGTVTVHFPLKTSHIRPGHYRIELRLNNCLCKTIALKVL
jgi:hypothetical protein